MKYKVAVLNTDVGWLAFDAVILKCKCILEFVLWAVSHGHKLVKVIKAKN